jgi:hypothetical protein
VQLRDLSCLCGSGVGGEIKVSDELDGLIVRLPELQI